VDELPVYGDEPEPGSPVGVREAFDLVWDLTA
jgi:hypothetical protein